MKKPERERRRKVTNPKKKVTPPSPVIYSISGGLWAGRSAAESLPAGVAAEAGDLRVRVRVWGSGWGSFHGRRL